MSYFFNKSFAYTLGHLIFIGLLCGACGRSVEHSKYIPKEASFVISLNMPNIQSKSVDWNHLFSRDVLQILGDFKSTESLQKNLKNSGIDFKSPVYFFSEENELPENNYFAVSFKLESESAFDGFLRTFPDQNLRIRSFSGMRYVIIDEQTILGWMNRAALLIKLEKKANEDVLKNRMIRLRDLPEDRSLLNQKDKRFKFLKLSTHDLAAWVNLEVYEKKIRTMVSNFPLPLNLDLKNNYLTAKVNFEQGRAITDIQFFNENNSFANYGRLAKDSLNQSLLRELPLAKRIGLLGLGLDMKGIKELFNNLGGAFFEGQALAMTGSTPNDLMDMLTGDFIAVLKDIYAEPKPDQGAYEYLLALGIKKPITFGKMLKKLQADKELEIIDSASYYMPNAGLYLVYRQPMLYLTASPKIREDLQKKNATTASVSNANKLPRIGKKSFLVFFADIKEETRQKLPKSFFGNDRFLEGMTKYTSTPFESISVNVQPLRDKKASAKIILNFKDKAKNSLKALADAFKPREPSE